MRAFACNVLVYATPFVWNHLPNTVCSAPTYMSCRRNLKTYLFNQAFHTESVGPIRNYLWLLTVLRILAILFEQVGFEPQFTGGVSNF